MRIKLNEEYTMISGPITGEIYTTSAGKYNFARTSVYVVPEKDAPNDVKYIDIRANFGNYKFLANAKKGDLVFAVLKHTPNTYTNKDGVEINEIQYVVEYINITPGGGQAPKKAHNPELVPVEYDDDLPF